MREHRLFFINRLEIQGNKTRHPAAAMNDVRGPAKLLHGLQRALAIKHRTQAIVVEPFILLVMENEFPFEQIFVVQEINLQTGIRKRGYLDLQREIVIIHRNIDPTQANDLMESMSSLIHYAKTWHYTTHLEPIVI